jgi:hypothetical protein
MNIKKAFETQSNSATEQKKEEFGLKPEKVIHLFG